MDYSSASYHTNSPIMLIYWVLYVIFIALYVVCGWKIYVKANRPGWASLIPFYNQYVLLQIVDRPGWWLLLYFIPIVNLFIYFRIAVELGKVFGKGSAFSVFLLGLFSFIGYPILAFGKSQYIGGQPTTSFTPTAPVTPNQPIPPQTSSAAAPQEIPSTQPTEVK